MMMMMMMMMMMTMITVIVTAGHKTNPVAKERCGQCGCVKAPSFAVMDTETFNKIMDKIKQAASWSCRECGYNNWRVRANDRSLGSAHKANALALGLEHKANGPT
jgi:ribosomal protein L37E